MKRSMSETFKIYTAASLAAKRFTVGPTCGRCPNTRRDHAGDLNVLQVMICNRTGSRVGTWKTNGYPGEWDTIPKDCPLEALETLQALQAPEGQGIKDEA